MVRPFLIVLFLISAGQFSNAQTVEEAPAVQVADARQDAANQFFKEALKLYRAHDLHGAAEKFALGLQIAPESVAAHFYYGETLKGLGQYEEGIRHLKQAKKLGPDTKEGIMAAAILIQKVVVAPKTGRVFRDCSTCPEMVVVPAGSFKMGDLTDDEIGGSAEQPVHPVSFLHSFAIGKYEVTQPQWRAIMGNDPSTWSDDKLPVWNVSWNEIKAYLANLNSKLGLVGKKRYRLLSEAEWEYAARAGTTTIYSCGNDEKCLDRIAWYGVNSGNGKPAWTGAGEPHAVGSKAPNAWGLHDMIGNLWEFVEDCWNDGHDGAPDNGSAFLTGDCQRRVVRGGGWFHNAKNQRSAVRGMNPVGKGNDNVGFRVARTIH